MCVCSNAGNGAIDLKSHLGNSGRQRTKSFVGLTAVPPLVSLTIVPALRSADTLMTLEDGQAHIHII